jgi:hypothetical protein
MIMIMDTSQVTQTPNLISETNCNASKKMLIYQCTIYGFEPWFPPSW